MNAKIPYLLVVIFLFACAGCRTLKNDFPFAKPEMVRVKGGTFLMGDVIDSTNTDALPIHSIYLGDFYIGRYEVTFAEYDNYALHVGRDLPQFDRHGRGNRAVVRVDWQQARDFCRFFGWRLPTENEWEYAARARGLKQRFAGTDHPDSLSIFAHTKENTQPHSQPVGTKKPNQIGLFDMSGNVYEWIGSYYQFYENPKELHDFENNDIRIIRGGSFASWLNTSKVYWRVGVLGDAQSYEIGFRCAISQKELNERLFLNGFFRLKPVRP